MAVSYNKHTLDIIVRTNYHNTENTIPDIKMHNNHTPEKKIITSS